MKRLLYLSALLLLIASCKKDFEQPASPGRMIKEFKLESGQYGSAIISSKDDEYKVVVLVRPEADLSALKPIIHISDDAVISPASGETIDVSAEKKITYTVTSASGQSRKWEVEFRIYDSSITNYGTYSIAPAAGGGVMQVQGDYKFNEKYWDNALVNIAAAELAEGENLKRWQEWDIIYNSTEKGVKYYQIRNLNSGMFLNGTGPGTQMKQNWGLKVNKDLQLWKIQESADAGKYEISNKANGLYLTLSGGTGLSLIVTQETKQNNDKQLWEITKLRKDSYRDGDVTNFFNRTTGSVAFDQGNSIPLSDGRALWITQDAWYEGSLAPNGRLYGNHFISYTNSIIIQPSIDNWSPDAPMMTADGAAHNIGNICPKQPGKDWSWPGPGVQIGEHVYMHCSEGKGLNADFQSLYVLTQEMGNKWKAVRTTPPGLSGQNMVTYSTGMVKANDGYVYSFGSRTDPNSFGYETFLYVARFPQNNPQDWTFWNGTSWSSTVSTEGAAQINKGLGTNSVGYLNGKYIHLTMDQGFYCGIPSINMYISTSPSPTGPFTQKKLVYSFTEFYKGSNARVYTPSLHTESVNGKNELLITYSINYGACVDSNDGAIRESDGNLDPYYYRVKGVRVPYEMFE